MGCRTRESILFVQAVRARDPVCRFSREAVFHGSRHGELNYRREWESSGNFLGSSEQILRTERSSPANVETAESLRHLGPLITE